MPADGILPECSGRIREQCISFRAGAVVFPFGRWTFSYWIAIDQSLTSISIDVSGQDGYSIGMKRNNRPVVKNTFQQANLYV